jgi:hypothetical protein
VAGLAGVAVADYLFQRPCSSFGVEVEVVRREKKVEKG